MTKCRIYNTTNVDNFFDLGTPIRYEKSAKDAFYEAYRIARKAYNRGKDIELFIASDSTFSVSIATMNTGLLISTYNKSVWAKEVW